MRSIARTLHTVVAWVFVAALVVQVWLAGRGVFESPTMFDTHRNLGYTLSLFTIVLLVLGILGGMGRRPAILAVVIFGLFILQSVLVLMREFDAGRGGPASRQRLPDPVPGDRARPRLVDDADGTRFRLTFAVSRQRPRAL